MEFELIRSKRTRMTLEVTIDGRVIVRAPLKMSRKKIDDFVAEKEDWIKKSLAKMEERNVKQKVATKLSDIELKELTENAREDITKRVEHFAPILGVTYERISIRKQKTMWGSCSGQGNLSFNCLLMFTPEEVRDYVVVHELAHRIHMDHSKSFWATVESVIPDYKERKKWLKDYGGIIIAKLK